MSYNKISEALGIENVSDFLKDLDIRGKELHNDIEEKESQMREQIDKIDSQIQNYDSGGIENIKISDIESSLSEIKELIVASKQVIQYSLESIITSELVDAEALGAFAKIVESTKLSISEYIELYKQRLAFYDKVRLEAIKHQYKLEEMREKQKLDIEKWNATSVQKEVTVEKPDTVGYSQEEIIKSMS